MEKVLEIDVEMKHVEAALPRIIQLLTEARVYQLVTKRLKMLLLLLQLLNKTLLVNKRKLIILEKFAMVVALVQMEVTNERVVEI